MKSLDQIIKDPSIIIMVIVMLMVKIVVITILASTYWAPCVKHYVSVFHIVLGKHCFSLVLLTVLLTPDCVGFSVTLTSSVTPAGCPAVQF